VTIDSAPFDVRAALKHRGPALAGGRCRWWSARRAALPATCCRTFKRGRADDPRPRTQRRDSRRAALVAQQAVDALGHDTFLPAPHTVLDLPLAAIIPALPAPWSLRRMIVALQTCFWGELRASTIARSRAWSAKVMSILIPVHITRHGMR
jgi:hypothetical protein